MSYPHIHIHIYVLYVQNIKQNFLLAEYTYQLHPITPITIQCTETLIKCVNVMQHRYFAITNYHALQNVVYKLICI